MSKDAEFDIALSFAGEDRPYVDQVANFLRDSGVKVFYDLFEEVNLWGKNLYDYLTEIYKDKALFTIIFISEHYSQKLWTNLERQAMQARAFQENQEYILPARFDNTQIPGILPTIAYISLANRSPNKFGEVILKKLVYSGRTVPSELIRKSLYSTSTVPRVDPINSKVIVRSTDGEPVSSASVIAIADNSTIKSASTDQEGIANLIIPTRRLYKLLVAHSVYSGVVIESWDPHEDIIIDLFAVERIGSVICKDTCYINGLAGRLNPILDTINRTYLYADNIAIDGGKQQPVTFSINVPFELEDCNGVVMEVRVLYIQGRTSLLQYIKPLHNDC
ncbi:TIR domain-containing protein [Nodularia harveyana UHCC-0300]|uniref:TIR domain-containing protein n=1 Tax=Nodularia harveyana UHCC-0300 TaxID=2974287 RepID=A0ABU5UD67_9CYAN|nr:TIR domain-containing protein [Nodularia harveyana]MEA5581452.1 TIR domain-containing protein [Nodularia harveyana UHCC-0300]